MPHVHLKASGTILNAKIPSGCQIWDDLMRVVLQSNSTSLYLGNGKQWTPDFKDAHDFRSLANLIEFSRKEEFARRSGRGHHGKKPRHPVLSISHSEAVGSDLNAGSSGLKPAPAAEANQQHYG